jgi:hypothetical protein
LIQKYGNPGDYIVWVLLTRIKRYLFTRSQVSESDTNGYIAEMDKVAELYYPRFTARSYEDSPVNMLLDSHLVSPWGDDPSVVDEAGQVLLGMFDDALTALALG